MSFCIQRNASFDSGFMLMRQITEALVLKWLLSPSTLAVAYALLVFWVKIISRAVFSLVCTPVMLGIMVGLDQKDSYALFPGCGMYKAGIAAILGASRFQRNAWFDSGWW